MFLHIHSLPHTVLLISMFQSSSPSIPPLPDPPPLLAKFTLAATLLPIKKFTCARHTALKPVVTWPCTRRWAELPRCARGLFLDLAMTIAMRVYLSAKAANPRPCCKRCVSTTQQLILTNTFSMRKIEESFFNLSPEQFIFIVVCEWNHQYFKCSNTKLTWKVNHLHFRISVSWDSDD